MKSCQLLPFVFSLCAIPAQLSLSQSVFEWNAALSEAEWTSYTVSHDRTGGWSPYLYENESPIDGASGVINHEKNHGVTTLTDLNSKFDLSATGSSVRTRMTYHFMDKYPDTGGKFHLYEFGLSTEGNYFGAPNDDSVLVAGILDYPFVQNNPGTYDLVLHDENSVGGSTKDGVWKATTPLAVLGHNYNLDAIANQGNVNHTPGVSSLLDLTWTNLGNGKMELDYKIIELASTGPSVDDIITSFTLGGEGTIVFNHGLESLTAVSPALGYRNADGFLPTSGAAFDWAEDYFIIPEPSSALLITISASLLFFRRRR